MNISLNGAMPTVEDIERLRELISNGGISVTEFNLEDDWSWYEGNIEWDRLAITFSNRDVLVTSGYNAIWEILSFDKLQEVWKRQTMLEYFDWILYDLKEPGIVELFVEEED